MEEIVYLMIEILDRTHVLTGTIFLLCSASHLNNVGSSIYAEEWCNAVAKFPSKIRNVKIMPQTPIIRENGPGFLTKQLVEISMWFKRVYDKNTHGLLPVWSKLGKSDEDGLDLGFTDTYSTLLPSCIP